MDNTADDVCGTASLLTTSHSAGDLYSGEESAVLIPDPQSRGESNSVSTVLNEMSLCARHLWIGCAVDMPSQCGWRSARCVKSIFIHYSNECHHSRSILTTNPGKISMKDGLASVPANASLTPTTSPVSKLIVCRACAPDGTSKCHSGPPPRNAL